MDIPLWYTHNSESDLQIREDVHGGELDKRSEIKRYTQQEIWN